MYRFLRISAAAAVTGALLVFAGSAGAAAGDLDPLFGTGGFATAPANATYPTTGANEIALTPSGQILAAGNFLDGGVRYLSVQRFNANGSIDTSFGDGGLATLAMPPNTVIDVAGIGEQPGGAVVVGARKYSTAVSGSGVFAVFRFTQSGQLDTTFDGDSAGNGILELNIGQPGPPLPDETERKLIVEPSGKIVISGGSIYPSFGSIAIGRLDADGKWDSSFSGDGKLSIPLTTTSFDDKALADVPGDAGYVIGGRVLPNVAPTITQPTLVRISESGALDASFTGGTGNVSSTPGIVTYYWSADPAKLGEIQAVAPTQDGGFVAGGYQNLTSSTVSVLARYSANGGVDSSFGTNGIKVDLLNGDGSSTVESVAVQPDGKILAAFNRPADSTGFLGRYNADGSPDSSFGSGGLISPAQLVNRVVIQTDGMPVANVVRTGQTNTTLVRLLADPIVSPPADPVITIKSPAKRKLKASKLKTISGTAGPAGSVKKVEIALQRKDSKLLKKKKRCLWLSSAKAKFRSVTATRGKCSKPSYRAASGTTSWKYKLTKKLPAGSYALTARVTLSSGRSAQHSYMFRIER